MFAFTLRSAGVIITAAAVIAVVAVVRGTRTDGCGLLLLAMLAAGTVSGLLDAASHIAGVKW